MQYLKACLLALAATSVTAAPSPFGKPGKGAVQSDNPFIGKELFANSRYAKKVEATIKYFLKKGDWLNAGRARTVQKIPSFFWISNTKDIPDLKPLIKEALFKQKITGKKQLLQLVVYNLPDRDCSAKASDGQFKLSEDGLNKYKAYVDDIAKIIKSKEGKQLNYVVVIEPDSLGNMVTNMAVEKCAGAASAYKEGTSYTIAKLQGDNIDLYIDAAHGGWLGWNDNLAPSAAIFAEVLEGAKNITNGKAVVRGLATNVSNYNQYQSVVRENFTEWSNSWDEWNYVNSLTPHLEAVGYPAHFIVDQGRAGRGAIKQEWGQWCNIANAGYGTRPTSDQKVLNNTNVDAIVWVKPGGESDGTSDETAARFDEMCRSPVAKIPAPEAGEWFNEYIVDLIKNANPPIKPSLF